MNTFSDPPQLSIECATCPATATTACGDCVIAHLLANDDGPIQFQTTETDAGVGTGSGGAGHAALADDPRGIDPQVSATDQAIALFAAAGLLDDPPLFVSLEAFEQGTPEPSASAREYVFSAHR